MAQVRPIPAYASWCCCWCCEALLRVLTPPPCRPMSQARLYRADRRSARGQAPQMRRLSAGTLQVSVAPSRFCIRVVLACGPLCSRLLVASSCWPVTAGTARPSSVRWLRFFWILTRVPFGASAPCLRRTGRPSAISLLAGVARASAQIAATTTTDSDLPSSCSSWTACGSCCSSFLRASSSRRCVDGVRVWLRRITVQLHAVDTHPRSAADTRSRLLQRSHALLSFSRCSGSSLITCTVAALAPSCSTVNGESGRTRTRCLG